MLCSMESRIALLLWYQLTGRLREVELAPGDRVEPDARHVYVVTRGTAQLLRHGPGGHDILLRIVGPGAVVRDRAILVAQTRLELLAMPRGPFSRCVPADG